MVLKRRRVTRKSTPPPTKSGSEDDSKIAGVSREALKALVDVDPLIRADEIKRKQEALERRAKNKTLKTKRRVEFSANRLGDDDAAAPTGAGISRLVKRHSDSATSSTTEPGDLTDLESDNEGDLSRIGNVDLNKYYSHSDHIGYDVTGLKISKNISPNVTTIADYIKRSDDPNSVWRTIKDLRNQTVLELTPQDIDIIRRVRARGFPISTYDPYGPDSIVDYYNPEAAIHPESNAHPPKRGFLPSVCEQQEIRRLVTLLRAGKIKVASRKGEDGPQVYDVWGPAILYDPDPRKVKGPMPLPAPKVKLPEHAESYNPPAEYLLSEDEKKAWMEQDPEDREHDFIPARYGCLRRVPAYLELIRERFNRCLDLYLCPRSLKMRMNVDPESLLPELPDPKTLRPYPSSISLTYTSKNGDCGSATCMSFDATGTYLAVGYSRGTVSIFHTLSSRHLLTLDVAEKRVVNVSDDPLNRSMMADATRPSSLAVSSVRFSPALPLIAIAQDADVYVFECQLLPALAGGGERRSFSEEEEEEEAPNVYNCSNAKAALAPNAEETTGPSENDVLDNWSRHEMGGVTGWKIRHSSAVQQLEWHSKGMYLATVCPDAPTARAQLGLHALQRQKSIRPFRKETAGKIQLAKFHPKRRSLYVAFHRSLRLYDLQSKSAPGNSLVKKFVGIDGVKDLEAHPSGEHMIVGGGNNRLLWFDHEVGEHPYKTLRCHQSAVTSVGFHTKYPLAHSADREGNIMVLHAKVHNDILTSPSIVPIRKLNVCNDLNKTHRLQQCVWHPVQPWLAVALSSGEVVLYV